MAIKKSIVPTIAEFINIGDFDGSADSVTKYAAAILGLDSAQQRAALSAKGLSAENVKLVISRSNELSTLQKLTVGELSEKLRLDETKIALLGKANATDQVTLAMLKNLLLHGKFNDEQKEFLLALYAETAASNAQTGANLRQAMSYKTLGASMKAAFSAMLATPMGWVMILSTVLPLVISIGSALHVTAEEAREDAEELHSTYEGTKSELEGVNSELQTSRDRLAELLALSEAGTISIVEQQELEDLQREIALLEQRQRFLDNQKDHDAEEANKSLEKAFDKESFSLDDVYSAERTALEAERNELRRSYGDWSKEDEERYHWVNARLTQLREMASIESRFGEKMDYDGYVQRLVDEYEKLYNMDPSKMTEHQLRTMDELRNQLNTVGGDLSDYIGDYIGDSETKAAWQELLDMIDQAINKPKLVAAAMDELPQHCVRSLTETAEAGKLTADEVEKLAGQYPDLKTAMDKSGATAEEVAKHFNSVADSADNGSGAIQRMATSSKTLAEQSSNVKNGIASLKTAFDELNEDGEVSYSTLADIQEKFAGVSGLDDYISKLAAVRGNSEEVALIMGDMIDALVETKYASQDLAEADENVIAAMLKEAGVANSVEYAHWIVTRAKIEHKTASYDLANASAEALNPLLNEIQALLGEGDAAQFAEQYLAALRMEKILSNDTQLDNSASVQSLIEMAGAAGASAESLKAYAQAKKLVEDGTVAGFRSIEDGRFDSLRVDAAGEANRIIAEIKGRVGNAFTGSSTFRFTPASSKSGSSSSSKKEVEEYLADIDRLYKYLRKVEQIQQTIEKKDAAAKLIPEDDFEKQIQYQKELINLYGQEQKAVHTLADERRKLIDQNIQTLESRGFKIEYDSTNAQIMIKNMEHLNELVAKNKGEYDTVQDATNAYRKETEELIGTLEDQVAANYDNGKSWIDLSASIRDAKINVVNSLQEMVTAASDAVDEIQNVSDTLYQAADEYASNDGFITVDTYQSILELGPQYLQMLEDENGKWEINEERINAVIAARTRQLAVENAMSYVERLKLAAQDQSIENLDDLIFVTTDATNSTWGLVYAELELMHTMGELTDSQYLAALHNIDAMQNMAENAINHIGKVADSAKTRLESTKENLEELLDELEEMQDGTSNLIDYVMDMLKHRVEQQITLLEEMKDKYSDIINLKKESLDAAKEEQDYQKDISKKLKEMAKLQERINALSLDDSRSAQAEKAKLLEELAGLQEDLDSTQADKAIETQKESLDKMEEDYRAEKDEEIKILEESISSTQKIWDMSINYIRNNWDTLYNELISWNTEYGTSLNSEINDAWDAAQAAADRYGDFVTAIMGGISDEIDKITSKIETLNDKISNLSSNSGGSSGGSSDRPNKNTTVSNTASSIKATKEDSVKAIVNRMQEYGSKWNRNNDKATNDALHQGAVNAAKQLDQYGVHAEFHSDGTWWITKDQLNPRNVGKLLYNCYHTGGFIGNKPLKPNERYIKAENGELIMTADQQDSLAAQIDRVKIMTEAFMRSMGTMPVNARTMWPNGVVSSGSGSISNITNNNSQPIEVRMGDITIHAPSGDGKVIADEVRKITRENMNQIGNMLRR